MPDHEILVTRKFAFTIVDFLGTGFGYAFERLCVAISESKQGESSPRRSWDKISTEVSCELRAHF